MYPCVFVALPVFILIITGTLSTAPGDPFMDDIDNSSDSFLHRDSKYVSNKKIPLVEIKLSENQLLENESITTDTNQTFTTDNKLITSSIPINTVQETLPIYKKHLVQIAQWKYTDPMTHQVRYWYHTVGSDMGEGWIFDRILCQAYIRPKPDTIPIHVFHSEAKDIWTNTIQTESTLLPIGNNQWQYDGILFYAYKTSMNSSLLKPVWRYWNKINYGTEDVSNPRRSYLRMADTVDDDLPGWRLEHLLFYAFPPDLNLNQSEY